MKQYFSKNQIKIECYHIMKFINIPHCASNSSTEEK